MAKYNLNALRKRELTKIQTINNQYSTYIDLITKEAINALLKGLPYSVVMEIFQQAYATFF
jgi:hypothetical protein